MAVFRHSLCICRIDVLLGCIETSSVGTMPQATEIFQMVRFSAKATLWMAMRTFWRVDYVSSFWTSVKGGRGAERFVAGT